MNNLIIKLVIDLLIPISKNIVVYYMGKSAATKEQKQKELQRLNEQLKKFNTLLQKEKEIDEKYSTSTFDDIYDNWLRY